MGEDGILLRCLYITIDNHGVVEANGSVAFPDRGYTSTSSWTDRHFQCPDLKVETKRVDIVEGAGRLITAAKDGHRVESCQLAHGVVHQRGSIGDRCP